MNPSTSTIQRLACSSLGPVLACILSSHIAAQSSNVLTKVDARTVPESQAKQLNPVSTAQPAPLSTLAPITLDPPTGWDKQLHNFDPMGNALPPAPPNFRRLGPATLGEQADFHPLTLHFAVTTKLTRIVSGNEFHVEQGGSCTEGDVYQAQSTCTLLVRFTPHGAGRRLGHITVSHTASATSMSIGLTGYGYAPVLSFTPALITTVPGTYPASVGLLSGAKSLSVDGGDTLYVADTGNNLVRMMDSSGVFTTISSAATAPWGVAADSFGEVWFSEASSNLMFEIYSYGSQIQASGTGTGTCTTATPCVLSVQAITNPGQITINAYDTMFFAESGRGAAVSQIHPEPATLIRAYDPFTYQTTTPGTFAADQNSNLYSSWTTTGNCQISLQTLYNAENSLNSWSKVAGGRICGFSGDGGQARNAEISKTLGQFAFDAAGNMYFTDSGNQRVRRIDYSTGVINTIAGNGVAGYTGDGNSATAAELNNPTGVAVDSQGQVYVISSAASGQVIRKLGPNGALSFGGQTKGLTSATRMITVSNTGNYPEQLTNFVKSGVNPGDFAVDPNTTNCNLVSGAILASGQSCKIGIKFTPSGIGGRAANLVFQDNTVNGLDTINLLGGGLLATPAIVINSPTSGQTFASSATFTFKTTVSGVAGLPTPTGSVQFKVDGANLGTPVTLASGVASTTVTGLSPASHSLSAVYLGDSNYAASATVSVTITITAGAPPPPSKVLLASAAANGACTNPEYAVLVTSSSHSLPAGKVDLEDQNKVLATSSLVNGRTTLQPTVLSPGHHVLVARYEGDADHAPAVSPALNMIVTSFGTCTPLRPNMGSQPDRVITSQR